MRIFNMKKVLVELQGWGLMSDDITDQLDFHFRDDYLYCGWGNKRLGLETSPLANPYTDKANARKGRIRVANRDVAVEMYRRWLWERICEDNQEVLAELRKVTPTTALVCWCAPKRCHCEVISNAANWLHQKLCERVRAAIISDRLVIWVKDHKRISVNLRNEVGGGGAYYTSVGWFGSCSYKQLIENVEFLERGGNIKELYDPERWGRVVETPYATKVWPE